MTKSLRYLHDGSGNRVLTGEGSSAEYPRYNQLNQLTKVGGKGPALIEGTVNEPSTVTVNGQRTETVQVPGTSTYRFERQIEAKEGSNTVQIVATDNRNNTRTDQWQFTLGPVAKTLGYDLNGNLLGDGTRTLTWDAKNRLKSATVAGVAYSWEYDGLDRRIRESRDGTLVKEWIWDGLQMIQERDGAGVVVKMFYDEGTVTGGATLHYTKDHLGNIREVLDSTGAVRARYDYDLYGKREKLSGDLDADFGFTGHLWHGEIGLYLAPYRAYDPELGRWISADPLGEVAGMNLYSYVLNNPISLWDPDGLEWFDTASNFFGGVGDNLTFGLTRKIREGILGGLGMEGDGVDRCSDAYKGGEIAGTGLGLAMGGAHLGRNAIAQMGKSGNLLQRAGRGISRLAYDNRTWGSVRSTWSTAMGGLRNSGTSLHHTFIPQGRWGASVPQGIRNAGFNYMPVSAGFNSWMNGSTALRNAVEWGFKGAVGMIEGSLLHDNSGCP